MDAKLKKLLRRDRKRVEIALKKAQEVAADPSHFKNLHAPLQHLKRVHIDSNFVLTFSVDENEKTVTLERLEHHDYIYGN